MLNYIWLTMMILAIVLGGINGKIDAVTTAAIDAAAGAVETAIGLIGVMALWLGLVKIMEDSGLMALTARVIAPVMKRIFPDIPDGHPAMSSITMNVAANMLGLNNAATPLGIKAMEDLEKLNKIPGVATNAMCTFLTINTGSVQLIPATMIGVMASAGSKDPSAVIGTTLAAGCAAMIAGITTARLLEKLPVFTAKRETEKEP